ncbi:GGDEF domain-containing protein [Legionella genomosp. 1]|uniref:GGDEF domain-containing protein n=1 Tax=Legionella genomosp. 1 TaxID=1093625 RepID=UPI001054FD89|nr:GGDEF domain-containing protein [Legionella genomosp. 1]
MRDIRQIQDESFLLLLQSSLKAIPFNIFLSIIIWGYLIYRGAPVTASTIWFLAIFSLSILRWIYSRQCIASRSYIHSKKSKMILFVSLTFIMGGLWGSCYIFFYDYLSAAHQNIITLVLGGMAAGGIASLSIYLPAYYAYLLPMFIPLIVYNYSFLQVDKSILATMFLLFVIMLMVTAKFPSQLLLETIRLGKEKDNLIQNLNHTNHEKDAVLEEIHRISITDSLTGLYNRRYFDARLDEELRRAKRNQHYFNLILIDVDDFKFVNDNFGHPAGDLMLKRLARAIKKTATRANDAAFRIGGDEFAAMLANSTAAEAINICKKIQECFKEESAVNNTTLSIGIVTVPPENIEAEDIISAADKALYQAKNSGKNQIRSIEL